MSVEKLKTEVQSERQANQWGFGLAQQQMEQQTEGSPTTAIAATNKTALLAKTDRFVRDRAAEEFKSVLKPAVPEQHHQRAARQRTTKPKKRSTTIFDDTQWPPMVDNPVLLAPFGDQFMAVDGLSIRYRLSDAAAAKPGAICLVLIHGFCGNVTNYSTLWPLLIEAGYRLLAFDLPGWGLSSRVARNVTTRQWPTVSGANPYTYDYQANLVLQVLDQLSMHKQHERMVMVAHSYGGTIAAYAFSHLASLRLQFCALVLVGAPLSVWPVPKAVVSLVDKAPRFVGGITYAITGLMPRLAPSKLVLGVPFYDLRAFLAANPQGAVGWDLTFRVNGWRQAFEEWAITNSQPLPDMQLEELRQLPVLDVRGNQDKVVKVFQASQCQSAMHSEVVRIDKAGHLPCAEQPAEFLAILNDFVARRVLKIAPKNACEL